MNTFEASNGVRVVLTNAGSTGYTPNSDQTESTSYLGFAEMVAWREFFRAEEDKRLGRWRYNDHVVVYPKVQNVGQVRGRGCLVVSELEPRVYDRWENPTTTGTDVTEIGDAARAYFEAHPELKPWYGAQHEEIWLLTTPATGERPYMVVRTEEAGFRFFLIGNYEEFRPGLFPEEAQITAGRRIFPEVAS